MRARDFRPSGLPGPLPKGERLLWQGSPRWQTLALRGLHGRMIGIYFGLLLAWQVASALSNGAPLAAAALVTGKFALLASAPLALIAGYAWAVQQTTVYSITNRRITMRCGIALPMTINLPFAKIDGAALKLAADGTGDIALSLLAGERFSYMVAWPHVRPWQLGRAQPALRCVAQAATVSQVLARALAASAETAVPAVAPLPAARPQPAGAPAGALTA